jgi:hypothetical protein
MAVGTRHVALIGRRVARASVGVSLDRVVMLRNVPDAKSRAVRASNPQQSRRRQRPARSHGRAPKGGVAVMLSVKNA